MLKTISCIVAACLILSVQAKDKERPDNGPIDPTKPPREVKTNSGLKYVDLKIGRGAVVKAGRKVTVHYTGWLKDGTKFDSSLDRNRPFEFELGAGQVIQGWEEGIVGMRVGGKRKLIIPQHLAYADRGAGTVIPPNAELTFEVELLGINDGQ